MPFFVRVQIEYGFGCFQVRFGLVVSTVWIGSEYGFVTLVDESASESHTQNSTRTAPYIEHTRGFFFFGGGGGALLATAPPFSQGKSLSVGSPTKVNKYIFGRSLCRPRSSPNTWSDMGCCPHRLVCRECL